MALNFGFEGGAECPLLISCGHSAPVAAALLSSFSPVPGQRVVEQLVLVALPRHVAAEAQESGDVNPVDVLRVLHIAAQVELSQDALCRLLLDNTVHYTH